MALLAQSKAGFGGLAILERSPYNANMNLQWMWRAGGLLALAASGAALWQYWQERRCERPAYEVLQRFGALEVRRYGPQLVAETGSAGQELNTGFRVLAGYIFGANEPGEKLAMTAPVRTNMAHRRMSFLMPSDRRLEGLPRPRDPRVELRAVPARVMAVHSFSGQVSEAVYARERDRLLQAVRDAGLTCRGEVELAQYNSPFIPPPWRLNEVWLEVVE